MDIKVAYFTAEFGIDESLSIYSGGLGILAGDYIKSAHDLGIPIVGVGILYRKGYFFQHVLEQGEQVEFYPELIMEDLPLSAAIDHNGNPVIVGVPIAGRTVLLKVWHVLIGDVPVYLLDADVTQNSEEDRKLTDHLYGGDHVTRISQEIILGIGGVRAIRRLGIVPNVWHLNEGHAAFAALERIREYSAEGVPFDTAVEMVKTATIFTTHTPVPAGHDRFDLALIDEYFGDFYWQMGATREQIMDLGVVDGQFNMTRLAVSTAWKVNAVSAIHAHVTRDMLHRWMPQVKDNIPIGITNGVHAGTWISFEMKSLFDHYLEDGWMTRIFEASVWSNLAKIPDSDIWEAHQKAKRALLKKYEIDLDEDVLLVGFARRFATYKRANLIFHDIQRLTQLLHHKNTPIAIVFAGKAHPSDKPGQLLLQEIVEVTKLEDFQHRVFFIPNYDITTAKHLVQGVDVWLNTPIKMMEASGTSGQKAALNGVINCSVLDGWWAEGYNGKNGWAIGSQALTSSETMNELDSSELYRLFEHEIAPLFYARDHGSYSSRWTHLMKASIQSLAPVYNTHRMILEYVDKLYGPTAENQDV